MTVYDPEKWLETAVRGIKDYVIANVNTRIYNVVMEFPGASLDSNPTLPRKTIIHFEIDDVIDRALGMGDQPFAQNYDSVGHTVNPQWAAVHVIHFDVGVWASDDSGGITARMRAKQELQKLFGFPSSVQALRAATDGGDGSVEIIRYTGGSNAEDSVNDVRIYRMMGCELDVRVYSRTPISTEPSPAIEQISQSPGLTIIG